MQMLLPEIEAMIAEGKTQCEVAENFGFKDKNVVKKLLHRQREKQRKLEAEIVPRPKGRPRKDIGRGDVVTEQAYEIERLEMENKLLRDFLRSTEGGEALGKIPHHKDGMYLPPQTGHFRQGQ